MLKRIDREVPFVVVTGLLILTAPLGSGVSAWVGVIWIVAALVATLPRD